jgi:formamidopyrimidine-DNA glycosylase
MPELPEVETTRRGVLPHLLDKTISAVLVRQSQLRWPVPSNIITELPGSTITRIERRGKYLLFISPRGCLIIHLGMSGSLRITTPSHAAGKHDHLDVVFTDDTVLRYNDPRKFGAVLWHTAAIDQHPLLRNLGPEPLSTAFDGQYLWQAAQQRRIPVKTLIMDHHVVVGVGNIYASESLFVAGIRPTRRACDVSLTEYQQLASAIQAVLTAAITQGGTTLRDFSNAEGKPGYFQQALRVYGRAQLPCWQCQAAIEPVKIGQRSSFYCPQCQPA